MAKGRILKIIPGLEILIRGVAKKGKFEGPPRKKSTIHGQVG
jgi:hypothetical protein